jgi:rSAM/selenodomain-associated transferase 2
MIMAGPDAPSTCSIIIPTLNESSVIEQTLQAVRERAPRSEVIVVDGESTDDTVERAAPFAQVISTRRGRGIQLNAGAEASSGKALLFLHADTVPDAGFVESLLAALEEPDVLGGAFRVRFDDPRPVFGKMSDLIAMRWLLMRTFTGDQAMFVRRSVFCALGGFRPWQFMEDVELSERMAWHGRTVLLDAEVRTSARRYRRWGLARTQATVGLIRALYSARVPPDKYARLWPPVRE